MKKADYVDLVLCKKDGRVRLFQAPKFSGLKPDDEVVYCATKSKEQRYLTIIDVLSVNKESDEYKFILELADMLEPYKLNAKVNFHIYDWSEDGDDDD